jgi:hypothetical protein
MIIIIIGRHIPRLGCEIIIIILPQAAAKKSKGMSILFFLHLPVYLSKPLSQYFESEKLIKA